ncbi:hypothetical protein PAMP_007872 [Pampus punctatissimus]
MCNTAVVPPACLSFKAESIAMVMAMSVKQGWFYECLTELDLETLRLRPSLLCSDPGHGNSSLECFPIARKPLCQGYCQVIMNDEIPVKGNKLATTTLPSIQPAILLHRS